jgi:DNA-directed RNA polymerase subunit omega
MEIPQNLDSKFRFILVAARRARQLQAGARPLVQTPTKKSTRVAQQEVGAGLVPIEMISMASDDDKNNNKKKPAK